MRTLLTGELSTALSWSADYYLKLEIQNGSGTWIDLATYYNGVINATWGEHIDSPVSQATFTLLRNVGSNSFAPFLEASPVNVDDVAAYSPLLELGRGIRASTATMDEGVTLDTGKYRQVFIGRIDRVRQTDNGLGPTPIVIECSDLGSWLMDMQIHDGVTKYGDVEGGVALEDVMQAVLDDKIPAGEPSVTLVKESSSNFAVTNYGLDEIKVFQALLDLVLDSVGEDVRYRYNSSHVSQLTWYDPDRSRVTVDATITTYNLQRLDTEIDNIRNSGELPFVDSTTGVADFVTSEDLASIAKYRERFQRLPESPLLTDATSAQATIDAVIHDLSGPIAEFEARCPYLWFVQLFDRYTFPADNRTYDDDQTLGVVGYQHSIEGGQGSTSIQCAGRIVGAYAEWLKRIPDNATLPTLDTEVPPLLSYTVRVEDSGDDSTSYLTAKVQGGPGTYTTRAVARIDREPTEEELDAATPSVAGQRSGIFPDACELEAGKRFYVAGRAYDANGNGTAIARISEVWLGLDSTPGADVTIGTIVSQSDKIIYPIAFDNECAYCEVWNVEYTSNPGAVVSVENKTPHPFRVLTLGEDAMVPGVEYDLEIPLAKSTNWHLTTFVPFDHLGKRGRPKPVKVQGDQGEIGGGGGGTDPGEIFGADLALWWDPSQETAYNDDDEITTVTDWGTRGNDGTAGNANADFYAAYGDATWSENEQNGLPMFIFNADANSTNILRQWVKSPDMGFSPSDGSFLLVVAKRHVIHRTFNTLAMFANSADSFSGTTATSAQLAETNGSEGAGTEDEIKWVEDSASSPVVYDGSVTTTIATYGILFNSATSALLYVDGVADPNGAFNPASDADTKEALRIGEGNWKVGDVVYVEGVPTSQQISDAFDYMDNKWVSGPGGGGTTPPDPPAAAVQIDNSTESVTVRVTMPAAAPDSIRIGVGSSISYDEAVSVAGGATQDFVITGLSPSTSYPLSFRSVEAGLVSTAISITAATDSEGTQTLDTLLYFEQAYSTGSQNAYVNVLTHDPLYSPALNHPLGTVYHLETSLVSGGPYTERATATDNGLSALITYPYAQTSVSHLLYYRVWATKPGWTDSAKSAESSISVPAR